MWKQLKHKAGQSDLGCSTAQRAPCWQMGLGSSATTQHAVAGRLDLVKEALDSVRWSSSCFWEIVGAAEVLMGVEGA